MRIGLGETALGALVACAALAGCAAENGPAEAVSTCGPAPTGEVELAGGTFRFGADPLLPEEGPPRTVRVAPFAIDRSEVTNGQFAQFVAATGYVTLAERPLDPKDYPSVPAEALRPSSVVFDSRAGWRVVAGANWRQPFGPGSSIAGREDHPVVQIGHQDALAFARWRGRDLPTEAEWEFAARGGLAEQRYSWGNEPDDAGRPKANYWQGLFPHADSGRDGHKESTAPVGCFPANGFGLHDMAGNVWEWTSDWYRPGTDAAPHGPARDAAFDPAEPGVAKHVIKGGSYLCAQNYCFRYRPAARQAGPPDSGSSHIGFRTVRRLATPAR